MSATAVNREELIKTFIEVKIHPEDFLVVKETLSRIGIPSSKRLPNGRKVPVLNQTCHILHKKGKYYIVHFKELFKLDNKLKGEMDELDHKRKRLIAYLLEKWYLLDIVSPFDRNEDFPSLKKLNLFIVPYSKKSHWVLEPKYIIGRNNVRVRKNLNKKKIRVGDENTEEDFVEYLDDDLHESNKEEAYDDMYDPFVEDDEDDYYEEEDKKN